VRTNLITIRRWAALAAIGAAALGIGLIVLGGSVAPCLGLPEISATCVAEWEAQRSWADRLAATPVPAFLLLAAVLIVIALVVRRGGQANTSGDRGKARD
jgi:hypothetical protein